MSYSPERKGARRQIYSGVSNEKSFHLPRGDKPAFIHIVLRNSDGATTNVCSFLPTGPPNSTNKTEIGFLQDAYEQSVPEKSILNRMVALGDQEQIIALGNVILDTIPDEEFIQKNEETLPAIGLEEARSIVFHVVKALKSLHLTRINQVLHVIETLTRALSRPQLVSAKAFFEAARLFIRCINSLKNIEMNAADIWNENLISDESMLEMLIAARLRLTDSCVACAARAEANPNSKEIQDAEIIIHGNDTFDGEEFQFSIKDELIEMEENVYHHLNKFFLGVCQRRDEVLGPLRAVVDGYGVVMQTYSSVVQLFDNGDERFGHAGRWKVGAVFPDNTESILSRKRNDTNYYMAVSNFPDVTLSSFKQHSVEQRPLSVAILDNNASEVRLRRLSEPILIALPPRKKDKVPCRNGFVSRSRMTSNWFPVHKRPNTTLHLEIELESTKERPFPVSIAVTRRKKDLIGPPHVDEIVKKRVVSRGDFRKFYRSNGSIIVKITLREEDFHLNAALFYVVLWNEQAMTSRSRHFDTETIAYSLRIWWSDCFYWNEFFGEWRQDGVKVSDQSTSTQTLCKTTHLSSFSASFIPVKSNVEDSDIGRPVANTALRGTIPLLFVVCIMWIVALYVHHRLLRSREIQTPSSEFRLDYLKPRFSDIGRGLRWFFGPDHKPNSVPIILHDNRKSHNQIFEVSVQTCCWPGSGTTSNVNIILYGEDGKYDARELITPKTHHAREARYENGYSENDDHTGIDDELFITGSTQRFVITFPEDLGPLWKIVVWHDNSGEWPNWKLDYFTVRDINNGKKWHFPCYGWLAVDRENKSLSAELRPVFSAPSFRMQIALKINAFLCNFSSIGSLIASPGYGTLPRSQRAVHLFTLFTILCGLTTSRYILEWDIYSHDSDLPYINGANILWGLLIGAAASILVLPAQLLLRFSKHDDRISVMIEDVTESHRRDDFPGDLGAYRYDSSLSIAKRRMEDGQHFDHDFEHYQGNEDNHFPSVEDAVCDWLEFKAESERKNSCSPTKSEVEKEPNLAEPRYVVSPGSRHSLNSLDEEIVRCMKTTLARSSESIGENSFPDQKGKGVGDDGKHPILLPLPPEGQNPLFAVSPRLQRELNSMLQSGSLLAEQYEGIGGIYSSIGSTLAMDAPEIVPCEKLEPLPQDFLLPRGCQKIAWCYYALFSIGACALTAYGSFTTLRTYDIGPWLECVTFSIIGVLLFIEGSLIIVAAIFSSIYDTLKWAINREDLWILLDRIFSSSNVSTITESTSDIYIDSSTYYPAAGLDSSSSHLDENLLEDARMARQLADRERSRYLRYIGPPETTPIGAEKAIKKRRMKKASGEWGSVICLLVLGIVSAATISNSYEDINTQSKDLESWFLFASTFPTKDEYLTTKIYENRNRSNNVFNNVRTKKDWMSWYSNVLITSQEGPSSDHLGSPSDYLLLNPNMSNFLTSDPERDVRYIIIGSPSIYLKYADERIVFKNSLVNLTETQPRDGRMGLDSSSLSLESAKPYGSSFDEAHEKHKKHKWTCLKANHSLHSVVVKFILFNPYSNLYSDISAKARFSFSRHSSNDEEDFGPVSVQAVSFALSEPGIDRTCPSPAYQTFYFSQMLLLLWATYSAFNALFVWTKQVLQKLTRSILLSAETAKDCQHPKWTRLLNACLEFGIWILVILSLAFSSVKRSEIEQLMPYLYVHEGTTVAETGHAFSRVIKSSTRLATTYGLLNFLLLMKLLIIARRYHNFPRVPVFTKRSKSTVGEVVIVLAIFWIAAVVIAGIGYVLFSNERPFSTFMLSLMNVVLSSISFGNFPAQSSTNFNEFRAKYGTIITLFFFLTIFVTFRLVLKAILIAVYRKRAKTSKVKLKKIKKTDTAIAFKDFAVYLWQKMKCIALYVVCVILSRDPGLWDAHGNDEFTSIGFSKSKSPTEREKKKLGHVPSNRSQRSSPAKEKVEEYKANEDKDCISKKYNLPSEVWLTEVETQLDELFTRASALADLADIDGNRKSPTNSKYGSKETQTLSTTYRAIATPVCEKVHQPDGPKISESDSKIEGESKSRFTAEKPPIRKSEERSKPLKKIHPRLEKSENINKQILNFTESDGHDGGISAISRNSLHKLVRHNATPRSPVHQRRAKAPVARKIHARWGQTESIEYVRSIPSGLRSSSTHDARRYGWTSDDDVLDRSSDVSAISSSSVGASETPVPPLTQHNLARHNYRIFSRQTSAATRATNSSGRTAEVADEPSTSTAPYQAPQEPDATLRQKFWRHLSSFKKSAGKSDPPRKAEVKARPLRRSRTNAINIKDIPTFPIQYDSDAGSDKTGKKSSASTTKMRTIFSISKLGFGGTRIDRIAGDSKSSENYCGVHPSELSSTHYRIDQPYAHDDLETFSIPGIVQSSSQSSMSPVNEGCKNIGKKTKERGDPICPQSRQQSNKFPVRIQEEDVGGFANLAFHE